MLLDCIIVGQGIAGTVLSYELLKEHKTFIVVDNNPPDSSSKIAAGLYNPVVFKRLAKSWMIEELLPVAHNTYKEMAGLLGKNFMFEKEIVKLFVSREEQHFWIKKSKTEEMKIYLSSEVHPYPCHQFIESPTGFAKVKKAGYLAIFDLLINYQDFLRKNKLLKTATFLYNDLRIENETVHWKEYKAKKVVFCEGYKAINNPFFSWLPFVLTKGQLLTIKVENLNIQEIINKGVFILPLGDDLFKIGATYEWNKIDEQQTEKGKAELLSKLEKILKTPYEVVEHKAGIRPTVKDRRPFLGVHPKFKNLVIFNGMGTKGVLLAPYFAKELIAFLEKKKNLHIEVNIERYYSLFSS